MDEIYDPAEIYNDEILEDTEHVLEESNVDCVMDGTDGEHQALENEEDEDIGNTERFSRTEGGEKVKVSVMQRLSPSISQGSSEITQRDVNRKSTGGHYSRLIMLNLPHSCTLETLNKLISTNLESGVKVDNIDGIYMGSAVVWVTPITAVGLVASKLHQTALHGRKIVARKMTARDHDIFFKKKKQASKIQTEGDSVAGVKLEKEYKVKIRNVNHSLTRDQLYRILKNKGAGLSSVMLLNKDPHSQTEESHNGCGFVFFPTYGLAQSFCSSFNGTIMAGRRLVARISEEQKGPRVTNGSSVKAAKVSKKKIARYRLAIKNVSVEVSDRELEEIFSSEVNSNVRVSLDHSDSAPHGGQGWVEFSEEVTARKAYDSLNGSDVGGSNIVLTMIFEENCEEDNEPANKKMKYDSKHQGLEIDETHDELVEPENYYSKMNECKVMENDHNDAEEKREEQKKKEEREEREKLRLEKEHELEKEREHERELAREREREHMRERDKERERERKREGEADERKRERQHDVKQAREEPDLRRSREGTSRDGCEYKSRSRSQDGGNGRHCEGVLILRDFMEMKKLTKGHQCRVHVSNIAYNVTDEKMIHIVNEKVGGLDGILSFHLKNGSFRGTMILEFDAPARVEKFCRTMASFTLGNRRIVVKRDSDVDRDSEGNIITQKQSSNYASRSSDWNMMKSGPTGQHNAGAMPMRPHEGSQMTPQMRPQINPQELHHISRGNDPTQAMCFGSQVPSIHSGMGPQTSIDPRMGLNLNTGQLPMMSGHASEQPIQRASTNRAFESNQKPMGGQDGLFRKQSGQLTTHSACNFENSGAHPGETNAETFGLSTVFLESMNIKLPLVKELLALNLDNTVSEADVKDLFSIAGTVVKVQYVQALSQAIVEMSHQVEAVQAVSMLHNQQYFDKIIAVRMLRSSDPDNLISRTAVPVVPRGLKTIGKGLGIAGLPLSATAQLPSTAQPLPSQAAIPSSSVFGQRLPPKAMNLESELPPSKATDYLGSNTNRRSDRGSRWDSSATPGPSSSADAYKSHGNRSDFRGVDSSANMDNYGTNVRGASSGRMDQYQPEQIRKDYNHHSDETNNKKRNLNENYNQYSDNRRQFGRDSEEWQDNGSRRFNNMTGHNQGLLSQTSNNTNRESEFNFNTEGGKYSNNRNLGSSSSSNLKPRGPSTSQVEHGGMFSGYDRDGNSMRGGRQSSGGRSSRPLPQHRGGGRDGISPAFRQDSSAKEGSAQSPSDSTVGREVILTNLPSNARQQAIYDMCLPYGIVRGVQLNYTHRTGRIIFDNYQQATMAADILNNQNYNGTTLKAMLA